MHWLIHLAGIDTQQSWAYDFWSGIGTQIGPALLGGAWLRHNNCHARRCPLLGRHSVDGARYCARHTP